MVVTSEALELQLSAARRRAATQRNATVGVNES